MDQKEGFEGWAILEAMGHRRHGGFVREVTIFGAPMARVDVPDLTKPGEVLKTHYYNGSSIYCLTPATEEAARAVARFEQAPGPKPLELPPTHRDEPDGDTTPPPADSDHEQAWNVFEDELDSQGRDLTEELRTEA